METKLWVKMPVELKERLKDLARLDRRNMTDEALVILEEEVAKRLREKEEQDA